MPHRSNTMEYRYSSIAHCFFLIPPIECDVQDSRESEKSGEDDDGAQIHRP